jgi:hypothetical protein
MPIPAIGPLSGAAAAFRQLPKFNPKIVEGVHVTPPSANTTVRNWEMHVLRGTFDSIYIAIQGSLPPAELERLAIAKEDAIQRRCPSFLELGPGQVSAEVLPHGHRGGYRFVVDTGPVGELWACRPGFDGSGWNIFVKPHATALLVHGYLETIRRIFASLEAMGATFIGHSVNRVDYAIDIRADDFLPKLEQFIKPARATCRHGGVNLIARSTSTFQPPFCVVVDSRR